MQTPMDVWWIWCGGSGVVVVVWCCHTPQLISPQPIIISLYLLRSQEVQELLIKHPLPAKPSKTLRHALNALRPRVNGLDSGLDLAVEISHIDYKATHKYDLVSCRIVEHHILSMKCVHA